MPHPDDHGGPEPGPPRWIHHDARFPVDPDLAPGDPGEPSPAHRPAPHVPRWRQHTVLGAIAAGGFLGALARYEVERAWATPGGHVPWATLAVNVSGSLALGLLLTVLLERPRLTRHLRPFLCVGFIGAWTTMSTFATETDQLVRHGHVGPAAGYLVATTVLGLAAGSVGAALGRRLDIVSGTWPSP